MNTVGARKKKDKNSKQELYIGKCEHPSSQIICYIGKKILNKIWFDKACLAASSLTTYVCAAAITQWRLENPSGLISRALQKLLIIIIIIIKILNITISYKNLCF